MIIKKSIFKILLFNLIIFNLIESIAAEQNSQISENEAIAYFILNCAYFTEWQSDNNPYEARELKIAVFADEELIKSIKKVAIQAKKSWFKDGEINIFPIATPKSNEYYHIVYFAEEYDAEAISAIKQLQYRNTLTIGSVNKFIYSGGAIGLELKSGKLKFDLNLKSLDDNRIQLKSGLKKRADKIIKSHSNRNSE